VLPTTRPSCSPCSSIAYCVGERSSRRIERRLVEDVAFRVVGANQLLDHATLARFRRRHAEAIAELFGQVLGLCVKEGLVDSKVISIDGTKIEANASAWANRTRRQLADEILAEAERQDTEEDERFGESRGDELPPNWARRDNRWARVREALRQLDEQGASDFESYLAERAAREQATSRKLPGRKGIADPDDPRIQERSKVLSRILVGELSVTAGALEMGVSYNWARQLLDDYRVGRGDPAVLRRQMLDRLSTAEGRQTYARRKVTTEPVFGNIKANLRCRRFSGRGMQAALSEWRLICSVHNLLKVRNHRLAIA